MDYDWLNTFLEVAKQKSFSRAGEKLHITQPSISAQVRSLETFLGYRLLDRGGGKVTLTPAGKLFQPFAEQALSQLKHIQYALSDLERMPRGTLTVSANDSTALYVLPQLIARFKKQHPRVSLSFVRAERTKTMELVLDREVELGIVSLPVKDPRLHVELIHEDKLVLVVPHGHPLTELESVKLADIAKYGLLLPKQGRRRESFDALFEQNKVVPRIAMEIDSNELLKRLILAGIGIGFLPRVNVLEEIQQSLVRAIDIEGINLPRNLALISRQDSTLSRSGDAFFTFATGSVRKFADADPVDSSVEVDT